MGRQGYPPEFRRRVRDLIEGARDLGISPQTIYNSRQQDRSTGTWARSIEGGRRQACGCLLCSEDFPSYRYVTSMQHVCYQTSRLLGRSDTRQSRGGRRWVTADQKTKRSKDLKRKSIRLYLSSRGVAGGRGFKRVHDRPEDAEVGRFSRGQERVERGDADLQETKPRFSRGQENLSDDDEHEREGRFSRGQEQLDGL
jgi:hypothetical protein